MAVPSYVAGGTSAAGTGDITPTVDSEASGDLLILVVETGNEAVAAPTGWTAVPGGVAIQTATRLTAFYRFATGAAETNPTVTDPGDHAYGRVFTLRGTDTTNPFAAVAVCRRGNDTSGLAYAPGVYCPDDECLILAFWSWATDSAGPLSSLEVNATLTSLTERSDEGTLSGNGGGFAMVSGELATAGTVDQTEFATGAAVATATMTIAIRPPVVVADTGLQLSVAARNGLLDAIETEGGASAIMKIRTGAAPATCATADSGTVLATLNLPADWMAAAAAGSKAKAGTWEDLSADATGTAGHFRIYKSDGTTCVIQGTVTASGGGGHMIVSTVSFVATDSVTISSFSMTAPGA